MWLLAAGVTELDASRGPVFNMESMAAQAARDGQCVALVGDIMVADDLAAGRLVRPFETRLTTPLSFSYYPLSALDSDQQPKVAAFRQWLLEETATESPDHR